VTACAEAGHKHQWRASGEVGKLCRDRPFFVDEITKVNSKNPANCATVCIMQAPGQISRG